MFMWLRGRNTLRFLASYGFVFGFSVLNGFAFESRRVSKENRAAGVLDNFAEGEKYKENFLRKYVRNKHPEIMPGINKFFTDPKYWNKHFQGAFAPHGFLDLFLELNLSDIFLVI